MKDRLRQFWQQCSPRERWMTGCGLAMVLAALMYFYAWQPLGRERHRLRASLPQLRANAERMHLSAAEAARLKALPSSASLPQGGIRDAVEQSAAAYKLRDSISQISAEGGGRLGITMAAVSFDSWARWLGQMQAQYRIRLESCRVEALPQPGMVRVQAVLAGKTAG